MSYACFSMEHCLFALVIRFKSRAAACGTEAVVAVQSRGWLDSRFAFTGSLSAFYPQFRKEIFTSLRRCRKTSLDRV